MVNTSVPGTFSTIAVPGIFSTRLRYRVHFPQKSTFSRGVGNYLFMGKGIRREGVKLGDFLNPVPIPQKNTFWVEVA